MVTEIAPGADAAAVWHEVECGGYDADLPLWERLADACGGPILDLGAGAGRVALHLARRGHDVVAVDRNRALLDELRRRAERAGLRVRTRCEDVREPRAASPEAFALALAPMQLPQLLGGPEARAALWRGVRASLLPGGTLATAIVDGIPADSLFEADRGGVHGTPDVREERGWVYSSLPLGAAVESGGLTVLRLRQSVSPEGRLTEERVAERLDLLDAGTVEDEMAVAGLRPSRRCQVAATEGHVASTVVVARRPEGG